MMKTIAISIISLLAILVMTLWWLHLPSVHADHHPVELPSTSFVAIGHGPIDIFTLTIDRNGHLYNQRDKINLDQFKEMLSEFEKNPFTYSGTYTNLENRVVNYTNTLNQAVRLRVDKDCQFASVKTVLQIIGDTDLRQVGFRINEK